MASLARLGILSLPSGAGVIGELAHSPSTFMDCGNPNSGPWANAIPTEPSPPSLLPSLSPFPPLSPTHTPHTHTRLTGEKALWLSLLYTAKPSSILPLCSPCPIWRQVVQKLLPERKVLTPEMPAPSLAHLFSDQP
jgi:hypothetical protein